MATNSSVTITVSPISSVPLMAIRDRKALRRNKCCSF